MKISGITVQGGGFKSVTQNMATMNAVFYLKKQTPKQILNPIKYLGSNSGGSWYLAVLVAYQDKDIMIPFDKIKKKGKRYVLSFFNKYWLLPVREHLFKKNNTYMNSTTDCNGVVSHIVQPQSMTIHGIEITVPPELISYCTTIQNINADAYMLQNVVQALKLLITILNSFTFYAWNTTLAITFLSPFLEGLQNVSMSNITMLKQSRSIHVYAPSVAVLYHSYFRYGTPNHEINGYPDIANIAQYVTSHFISYTWNNKSNEQNERIGGVMNCCYTFNCPNTIRQFIWGDTPSTITYYKKWILNPVAPSIPIALHTNPNPLVADICHDLSLFNVAVMSSSSFSFFNSKEFCNNVVDYIVSQLKTENRHIVETVVYQVERLILMNKSVMNDNYSTGDDMIPGTFWLNAQTGESETIQQDFDQTFTDPTTYSWNGIMTDNSCDLLKADAVHPRSVFNTADGAAIANNSGCQSIIYKFQKLEITNTIHIIYLEDLSNPTGTNYDTSTTCGFGIDLLVLFGVAQGEGEIINNIYKKTVFNEVELPFSLDTPSGQIFSKNSFPSSPDFASSNVIYNTYPPTDCYTASSFLPDVNCGVRISTFQGLTTVRNLEQGIEAGTIVNITILSTYSDLQLLPIPTINEVQFTKENNVYQKLILLWESFNDSTEYKNMLTDIFS